MAPMKPGRPMPPDFDTTPEQDVEGLGGPAVSGPPERDVEGLGPEGDVDHLDEGDLDQLDPTHRTGRIVRRRSPELPLDPRADDDALDTDEANRTEAYDSGLGQDPGEVGSEPEESSDGSATRSR